MTLNFLLSCFVLIIPIFNKSINFSESLVLYGGITVLYLLSFFFHPHHHLTRKFIIFEISLVLLSLISTIFSQNIGYSYYGFFHFVFSLILLNLCLTYLQNKKLSISILYFSLFYSLIFLLNKLNFFTIPVSSSRDNFILQVWGHSYLADLLIFSALFLLYQLLYSSFTSKKQKYFYYFSLVFILITTYLTNSRSALIAIVVGTIYIVLRKIPKYLRFLFVFSLLSLTIFAYYQIFFQSHKYKTIGGNRLEYWQQAAKAFLDRPLLGHGPNNFFYINKKYESLAFTNTSYAHNSVLEYLCLNGLPFTLIFFIFITFSLFYQFKHHRLNFAIGITALTSSLFDPTWNSMGIFCLSLFFIFNKNPNIILPVNSTKKSTNPFKLITLVLISLFFLSKTLSDFLFVTHHLVPSLYVDPFNLNPRLSLLPNYTPSTIFLYKHDFRLYLQLIRITPFPQAEIYSQQLFKILPQENSEAYLKLAPYYLQNKNYDQLLSLSTNFFSQLSPKTIPSLKVLNFVYNTAVTLYPINQEVSIYLFELLTKHYPNDGHFQVDLANAYWHHKQIDLALTSLQFCLNNIFAHDHCQEYLYTHQNNQTFNLPGQIDYLNYVNQYFPAN